MLLSIGIPVYNERYTLSTILDVVARALPNVNKKSSLLTTTQTMVRGNG